MREREELTFRQGGPADVSLNGKEIDYNSLAPARTPAPSEPPVGHASEASDTQLTAKECVDINDNANSAFSSVRECYAYVCTRTHDNDACARRGQMPLNAH